MSERDQAASVERFCAHDGCFRRAVTGSVYCCLACEERDLVGLSPVHGTDCVPRQAGRSDPRVLALAEGADERRKVPGKPDDLDALRKAEGARICAHDGCFRPAQEVTGYCCDTCNDADGDGLPPVHEKGCRRG